MKNLIHHRTVNGIVTDIFLLILAAFAVYSNNFNHEYHLDDTHLIPDNQKVRSLKYIPEYFTDPSTLTPLTTNIDYRPVLQITYALNYRLSGYSTWSWHLLQIILHIICAVCLYLFVSRVISQFNILPDGKTRLVAFLTAFIFTIHPTESGVINYLSARSSLLTAAFLWISFILYMKRFEDLEYQKTPWASAAFYLLALFTKVEAVGALPFFFLYDMLQTSRQKCLSSQNKHLNGPVSDALSTLNRKTFGRLWVCLLITGIYFVIRLIVMRGYNQHFRYGSDMNSLTYLMTQVTAWWYYIYHWFVPLNLVADNLSFPIIRSFTEPSFLLASAGWLLVVFILLQSYSKAPYLLFIVLSAFSLIAPTSSIAPLAEMVNEHRPYLPVSLLSCAWMIPAGVLIGKFSNTQKFSYLNRIVVSAALIACCASFFLLTWQRNRVFKTQKAYYQDIIKKAPSARAYANYGWIFMAQGDFDSAATYYSKALELAPYWHIVHINLALIYQHYNRHKEARYHYDRAVEYDKNTGSSRIYRGEYLIKTHEFQAALDDFENALPLERDKYRAAKGAATAASGLGDWNKAVDFFKLCFAEQPGMLENDIVSISSPFWITDSLCTAGLKFYSIADSLYPDRWWIHHNMGDLFRRCGKLDYSADEFRKAEQLKIQKTGG